MNKLLTPVNDIETIYKYVYDYLAEYRMKDTLTSTAVDQLRSFAVLCPMEYGRAVYIAQSILAAFDSLGTVYESDCGNIQYRRTIQKDEADELTNKVNLYPNPASDNVIVEFDLETFAGFEIEFYDYLGNRVMTTIVNKNKGSYTINTFAMAKGLYLYNITSNGQIIQSGKLMIIK